MEGDLRDGRLLQALRKIGRGGTTGILTVQGRDEIIALSFLAGGIVGADALNQSLEAGLGEVLASQHLVDPSEFAVLASEHEAGGGRVVDLLVERSYLSREQLLENLRLHTYRLCVEALSWREGEYRFYQGDEVAYEEGFRPIGVGELLVLSTRELGPAGPLVGLVPELHEVYARSPGAYADSESELTDGLGGSDSVHRVLGLLDGEKSLSEIAEVAGLTPFEVQDLAHEWRQSGVVEKVGSRKAAEAAVPAARAPDLSVPPSDPVVLADPPSLDIEETPPVRIPTEETAGQRRAVAGRVVEEPPEGFLRWLNRAFGLTFLVASVAMLILGPSRILLPFPWQGALREGFSSGQQTTQKLKIDRGAHTFFLLFGRYPESLDELDSRGLIRPSDRALRSEGQWEITANPASFVLRTMRQDGQEESSWTSFVAGDFLLDPEFVRPAPTSEGPPLVLLD